MKELFKLLTKAIYPALLSLFLFIFTTAFVKGEYLEVLELMTAGSTALFGVAFVVGVIGQIVLALKKHNEQ